MTYTFDEYNYVIKLVKGERLASALEQFCDEVGLKGAWINGIGGALEVTLGHYNLETKEHEWRTFQGMREVASLGGTLAADQNGKMMFHLHGAFGDREFQTVSGHVRDLVVGVTMELFVHRTWKPLKRAMDQEFNMQTLDLTA